MKAFKNFFKSYRRILTGAGICLLVIVVATVAFLYVNTRDELNRGNQVRLQEIAKTLDARLAVNPRNSSLEMDHYYADVMRKAASVLTLEPEDALDFDLLDRYAGVTGYISIISEDGFLCTTNLLVLDQDRTVLYSQITDPAFLGMNINYKDAHYDALFSADADPNEPVTTHLGANMDDEGTGEDTEKVDTYCTKCGSYYILIENIATQMEELFDADTEDTWDILDSIWIGDDTLLAVAEHETGKILYCQQESLTGATVNISQFRTLFFNRINGERYAAQAEHSATQKVDLLALTPVQTIVERCAETIFLVVALYLLVLVILISFVVCLRQGELDPAQEVYRFGKYFLRSQVRPFCVVSVVAGIFLVFVFVAMTNLNEETRTSQHLQEDVKDNMVFADRCVYKEEEFQKENSERFYYYGDIAEIFLDRHPEYLTKEGLQSLSGALDVKYLTLFDADGKTVCTASPLDHLSIWNDSRSPLYDLRHVLDGKPRLCVQGDKDKMDEEDVLYAMARTNADGVADGILAITTRDGMTNSEYDEKSYVEEMKKYGMETPKEEEQSDAVTAIAFDMEREPGGSLYFVLGADGTVLFHPEENCVGKTAEELGIPDAMRTDGYSGRFTLDYTDYLVAVAKSEETGNCVFLIDPIVRLTTASFERAAVILLFYMGLVCWILYDELGSRYPFERRASIRREGDSTAGIPWSGLPTEEKMGRVLRLCTYLFAAYLIFLRILAYNGVPTITGLSYILEGGWQKSLNFYSIVGNLCLVCLTYSVVNWVRAILLAIAKAAGQQGETTCRLIANLLKYIGVFFCIYFVLLNFGVDARATIASAGIAALGLSFGAQDLIKDMLAGMFIMLEGNFKVGDQLQIDEEIFEVRAIGIRTTTLVSCGKQSIGKKKIINNSEMTGILNVQNSTVLIHCDVQIGNEHDLHEVKRIFDRELPLLRSLYPPEVTTPVYKGVQALDSGGTTIRIQCLCPPLEQANIERAMYRDVKRILNQYGIALPLTEYIIHTENGETEGT